MRWCGGGGGGKDRLRFARDVGMRKNGDDSKKSGSSTVSHLRFSAEPIRAAYLIDEALFVGILELKLT